MPQHPYLAFEEDVINIEEDFPRPSSATGQQRPATARQTRFESLEIASDDNEQTGTSLTDSLLFRTKRRRSSARGSTWHPSRPQSDDKIAGWRIAQEFTQFRGAALGPDDTDIYKWTSFENLDVFLTRVSCYLWLILGV